VTPEQGDIWWAEGFEKTRPVLIVTRDVALPVLNSVTVAPVTSTARGIPTEVPLGPAEGLDHDSVASFDNLRTIPQALLSRRVGALGPGGRQAVCRALAALADC
jgi:mRNA interferase MazF